MPSLERSKAHPKLTNSATATFRMVFLTVAIGAALCALLAAAIAICVPNLTVNGEKIFDALLASFTLGVGAILGLLGGKSVD